MNKLTLVSMAMLCLLLTSCADRLTETETSEFTQLESRSANLISATVVTPEGVSTTLQCTRVEVNYENETSASALFTYANSNTAIFSVSELSLIVAGTYQLDVATDTGTFIVDNLNIDICEPELCYSDIGGGNIGTALDFIIEDESTGF